MIHITSIIKLYSLPSQHGPQKKCQKNVYQNLEEQLVEPYKVAHRKRCDTNDYNM